MNSIQNNPNIQASYNQAMSPITNKGMAQYCNNIFNNVNNLSPGGAPGGVGNGFEEGSFGGNSPYQEARKLYQSA